MTGSNMSESIPTEKGTGLPQKQADKMRYSNTITVTGNHTVMILLLIWSMGTLLFTAGCEKSANATHIREMAVAGSFYPADAKELSNRVKTFIEQAKVPPWNERIIIGALAPHAGYVYSGKVAGFVYKALANQKHLPKTFIIIGPAHHAYESGLEGISVYKEGFYQIPLGLVEIDGKIARAILDSGPPFTFNERVHSQEHCIEVQLPFLKKTVPQAKIVPILVGPARNNWKILGETLRKMAKKFDFFVLVSSDMSHYPSYKDACEIDMRMLKATSTLNEGKLLSLNQDMLGKKVKNLFCTYCGFPGVVALVSYAKAQGVEEGTLLKYANSGDTPQGDKNRVVGYGAMVFALPPGATPKISPQKKLSNDTTTPSPKADKGLLTQAQGRALLQLARKTLFACTSGKPLPKATSSQSPFTDKRGVFVTLKNKGRLRGCIGYIQPITSLEKAVIENTVNAALKDHRFVSVSAKEAPDIDIEISVLTVPRKIDSLEEFIIGTHGIILKKGWHQAVFLPQVAPEQGWDKATTLSYLSRKAGLDSDAWQSGTEFYIFKAQIFHE